MQKINLSTQEKTTWGVSIAALILLGLLSIAVQRAATREEVREPEDPYRAQVAKVDPVVYHSQRAYAYEAGGAYSIAAAEYRELLDKSPEDKDLHSHLASVYYKMGEMDKTMEEIKEVIRIDPNNWAQREVLADISYERGDYDGAIAEYEEALRSNPENSLGHSKLGRVYYLRGMYTLAEEQFNKSLEVFSGITEARLGLGLCALARGDIAGAVKQREALEKMKSPFALQLGEALAAREKPPGKAAR